MKKTALKCLLLAISLSVTSVSAQMPKWSYDAGPDPKSEMGKELIDITANIPDFPAISDAIIGKKQKFRPAFGPIPWRMRQDQNKVKMLFIGQDGTHIAEAAGRPATAGFGGRAQDLAKYFGVSEGAAFMNTYAFTIKGQYGIYGTPYLLENENGEYEVQFSNIVDNKLWLISQDQNSPITQWRNNLIDWIIRNNKDSMRLIVLFGGAARDAIAGFAESKGAKVGSFSDTLMDKIQVPEVKEESAGGNNTFPALLAKDGKDLYAKLLGKSKLNYSDANTQTQAMDALKNNLAEAINEMVLTGGGPFKNGLIHPAQLGGYNLGAMMVNGMRTRSLKGLILNDGTKIENDILVVELPHPSALSRTVMEASSYSEGTRKASEQVMKKVKVLDFYKSRGWNIEADPGQINEYAIGKNYTYGRTDIGPEYYDFGTPENRMVSKSDAQRMSGAPNVVILGSRESAKYDKNKIKKMTDAKPAAGINRSDLFIARPRNINDRYSFDAGPGEKMARIMKENLNLAEIYQAKIGMSFEVDGIAAYNIKTHPSVGDFGHYRGTFENPKVVVLADPIGIDDMITSRALTGERGQYIQGLMNDLGVEDQYLIIKTVPFGMDGATSEEWATVLEQTKKYRERVLEEVLKNNNPIAIIADGENAINEAKRIVGNKVQIIEMKRSVGSLAYGIEEAGKELANLLKVSSKKITGAIANIPRSHLSFYARVWEGTSGDRVLDSISKEFKGLAFAEVVPSWASKQKLKLNSESMVEVEKLIQTLEDGNLILPNESIPQYLRRMEDKQEKIIEPAA